MKKILAQILNPRKKVLKRLWIILDAFFLPLTFLFLLAPLIPFIPKVLGDVLGVLIFIPVCAGVLLRCFYIPQILAGILFLLSIIRLIRDYRSGDFSRKDALMLLLFTAVCAVNLLVLERLFWNAMNG